MDSVRIDELVRKRNEIDRELSYLGVTVKNGIAYVEVASRYGRSEMPIFEETKQCQPPNEPSNEKVYCYMDSNDPTSETGWRTTRLG